MECSQNSNINSDLEDEISYLIELHQEGEYWDFKRQWYDSSKSADLLHDIICMANNLANHDAYIIIGLSAWMMLIFLCMMWLQIKIGKTLKKLLIF